MARRGRRWIIEVGRRLVAMMAEDLGGRLATHALGMRNRRQRRPLVFRQQVLDHLDELVAQVLAVFIERNDALLVAEQEREQRLVLLGRVARLAAEHEVVAPVVRGLAAPRRDVIERHRAHGDDALAVGADGPVLVQQPFAGIGIRGAPRWYRGQRELGRGGVCAPALAASGAAAWARRTFSCHVLNIQRDNRETTERKQRDNRGGG